MDKRMAENKRVKDQIANAYFTLMQNRSINEIEEISVTQITALARVSRMAYYRNFKSKTDIIRYYVNSTMRSSLDEFMDAKGDFWTSEYGERFFLTMKQHRSLLLMLDKLGHISLVLEAFNAANEEFAGDMARNSIDRYALYFAAGATLNAALIWLRDDCPESPREMAECFERFCPLVQIA